MVHRTFSDFLGGQVAIDGLDVDEMFQKNPHDFGVFWGEILWNKELLDGGDSDVVSIVNFVGLEPFYELIDCYLHLIFDDDVLYILRVFLNFILQTSEEHP